jgi:hypothetical protein
MDMMERAEPGKFELERRCARTALGFWFLHGAQNVRYCEHNHNRYCTRQRTD